MADRLPIYEIERDITLARACEREGFDLRLAEKSLCTDNAAMIGILAERKLLANVAPTSLDEEINPGWVLA